MVDAAAAQVRHTLGGHPLRIDADETTEIEIDPRVASVALSHLVENAAQYSPPDAEIAVEARVERDGFHVAVTDHGPGLDPGELEHLFERFYRGRSARQRSPGTGMGLAITRGLLTAAGGQVWGENVARCRRAVHDDRSGAVTNRRGESLIMAARILVVDDEPNILGTLAPLLRSRGYEVLTAMSGRAAIEAVDRDKPDLVVLDLGLPDIDGVEVCRVIRETMTVPILVLSARGAESDKVRALDTGADDYVTKPFGAEELVARIRAALRRTDSPSPPSEPIVRGDLVIDRTRFRVLRNGEEVRLTPKEFELLTFLAQHPGRVLTHRTHAQGDLGAERRGSARAPARPRGIPSEEDRAQPLRADGTS